jgi:hypothetical protein
MKLFFFMFFFIVSTESLNINITNKNSLYNAFALVFDVKDTIETNNDAVLEQALIELSKMGVHANLSNICELEDDIRNNILMKAALGEYIFGLKDPNDWSVVVVDTETGRFTRKRSFSATRFAILESLLIISVLAMARVLWLK